ncbi:LOW QUALITY PROTEIN: melanocortin-2 receptor accessory protein [Sturnira hondurensis]|uniref:LOW QUALITY PROTEIN: melanocortin-2 receptor accessory protein n=1 Tax=Sturnira hondurensis TaxID=192404 RepID=UPI00187A06E9|nr:LOW QUALITY PROTEIN: melanocortin-2 receptor accessory protein [Sturnira hondurensis]
MVNGTNTSALGYSYEYYLDYLDPIPVDERKLRAHKHAIAIAFWVGLMAFVLLLLLTLLYVSWSGSPLARNHAQHQPTCPWGLRLDLPLRVLRHLLLHRPPRGTPQAPPSSTKEPQQLMQEGPAPSTPTATQAHPGLLWEWALSGDPMASADVGHKPSWPPLEMGQTPANHGHCRVARDMNQPRHMYHPKATAGHGKGGE